MATEIVLNDVLTHQAKEVILQPAALLMFFQNNGFVRLTVKAGATASGTMTIKGVVDSNRRTGDIVLTLGANKVFSTAFFEVNLFNQGGNVNVEFSAITDLEVSAIRQTI